jgi:hypothetical protein
MSILRYRLPLLAKFIIGVSAILVISPGISFAVLACADLWKAGQGSAVAQLSRPAAGFLLPLRIGYNIGLSGQGMPAGAGDSVLGRL